jgi:hypothetical protein
MQRVSGVTPFFLFFAMIVPPCSPLLTTLIPSGSSQSAVAAVAIRSFSLQSGLTRFVTLLSAPLDKLFDRLTNQPAYWSVFLLTNLLQRVERPRADPEALSHHI